MLISSFAAEHLGSRQRTFTLKLKLLMSLDAFELYKRCGASGTTGAEILVDALLQVVATSLHACRLLS